MAAFVALAPLIWATNFVVAKLLLHSVPAPAIAVARWAVAALIIGPLYIRRALRRDPGALDWRLAVMGLFGIAAFTNLLYFGLARTTVVNGGLLYATTPVFALPLGHLWSGEQLSWRVWAGLAATLAGIAVVTSGGDLRLLLGLGLNPGDGLVLASAVTWAIYSVLGRGTTQRLTTLEATGGATLAGVVWLLPYWPATVHAAWTPASVAGAVYLGVFPSIIAYVIWLRGIETLGSGATTIIGNLLPLFTTVLAHFLLGEAVSPAQWLGGLLIVGGVVGATWRPAQPEHAGP